MCVVFPPGAAHMSRTVSPGRGSRILPQRTEGRFCRVRKPEEVRSPPRLGQSKRGEVISTAAPEGLWGRKEEGAS